MPVTWRDIKTGRVNLDALAISRGTLHTLCAPDPQNEADWDLEPPVDRHIHGGVQGAGAVRTGANR